MRKRAVIFGLILFGMLGEAVTTAAESRPAAEEAQTIGRTPPRLSFLEGQVSFWRPGAEDWAQAQINTALAPGDQLYIEGSGKLELQVAAQAYVRGGNDAQIGLETQEPDFLRFKVEGGQVAFDLRSIAPGRTVEVDTPHGVFTMNHEGYFRLDVSDERTTFTTRRAGRASVMVATASQAVPMEPDESVDIENQTDKALAFQAAPAMDAWDTWNYHRTDTLLEAGSSRYISPGTYGAADLDRYGSWRVLPTYGRVWVPSGVAPDWAPYSTGSWMYDSYYGWTWVDIAPWGWAPYHYGRWVYVNSYWCWAPGPIVHHAVYAPALVAFFGSPGVSVGFSIGGPGVGWLALGWGEPLIPWWGRPGFIHRPWWGGWGGPHCINSHVIHHHTVVRVNDIYHYHNSRVHNALIVVDRDHFGHGRIQHRPSHNIHMNDWRPTHRAPDVRPSAASFAPSSHHGWRPPERSQHRSTLTSGPHSVSRPTTDRQPDGGRRITTQPNHGQQTDMSHGRSPGAQPPRGSATHRLRPVLPQTEQKPKTQSSQNDRRQVEPNSHKAPEIHRPSARHLDTWTANPSTSVRPPRQPQGTSETRSTGSGNDRPKPAENSSHFERPSQRMERRMSTPASRPPVARPAQPEPQRSSPDPSVSNPRGESPFRSSPRVSEPEQHQYDNRWDSRGGTSSRQEFHSHQGGNGGYGRRFSPGSRN